MATTDIYHIKGGLKGRFATAFLGGNTDDYIQIDAWAGDRAANESEGTFTAWINMANKTTTGTILCAGDKNAVEYLHFSVENGKLFAACNDLTTMQWDINSTDVVIEPHRWYHVALVQLGDGTIPKFYVNGVEVAVTTTTTTDIIAWFDQLAGVDSGRIGAANIVGNDTVTNEFAGAIGHVRNYDVGLTDAQILEDFGGVLIPTGLTSSRDVGNWDMEDDFIDTSAAANSGTAVGDIILTNNYSEFTSRLRNTTGSPAVADTVICFSEGDATGHAVVIQAA